MCGHKNTLTFLDVAPPLASTKTLDRAHFDQFKSSSQLVIFSGIFTQFDPSED